MSSSSPFLINFLSANDCYIFSHFPKLYSLLEKINPETLRIFGGDWCSGSAQTNFDHGKFLTKLLLKCKFKLFVLGNHEFTGVPRKNLEDNIQLINQNEGIVLSSNIQGIKGTRPYYITEHRQQEENSKVRIGWLGLCTEHLKELGADVEGLTITPMIQSAQKWIQEVEEREKVDFFIAITHAENHKDHQLIKEVPKLKLVLGGHDHELLFSQLGETLIVKSGSNMEFVSLGCIQVDPINKKLVSTSVEIKSIANNKNLIPNWNIQQEIEQEQKIIDKHLQEEKKKIVFVNKDKKNKEISLKNCRTEQNEYCGWFCDTIATKWKVDAMLVNAGLFSDKDLNAFILSRADLLYEFIRHSTNIFVQIRMTGQDLQDCILFSEKIKKNGKEKTKEFKGGYLQYGKRIEMNKEHMKIIRVNGKLFNPLTIYSVLVNEKQIKGMNSNPILMKYHSLGKYPLPISQLAMEAFPIIEIIKENKNEKKLKSKL